MGKTTKMTKRNRDEWPCRQPRGLIGSLERRFERSGGILDEPLGAAHHGFLFVSAPVRSLPFPFPSLLAPLFPSSGRRDEKAPHVILALTPKRPTKRRGKGVRGERSSNERLTKCGGGIASGSKAGGGDKSCESHSTIGCQHRHLSLSESLQKECAHFVLSRSHRRIPPFPHSPHPVRLSPFAFSCAGSPSAPRCGFSRKVVEALRSASIEFESFDILSDEEIRQGLKAYSDWPTYPQLYVNSQLVGGCDIILEMQGDGSLKTSIQEMIAQA